MTGKRDFQMTIDMGMWTGRVDAAEGDAARRWHQAVQPLAAGAAPGIAILGFARDEGVRRNQGRTGAVDGPLALRRALAAGRPVVAVSSMDLSALVAEADALADTRATGTDGPASETLTPYSSVIARTRPCASPATIESPTRSVPRWTRTVATGRDRRTGRGALRARWRGATGSPATRRRRAWTSSTTTAGRSAPASDRPGRRTG